MDEQKKWLPDSDDNNRPFFDGVNNDELRLQVCERCDTWVFPVKTRCSSCGGSDLVWKTASGRAVLYSHTQLRRAYHPRHEENLPVVAWVDLEEGVRINSNIVDCPSEQLKAGMNLVVAFEHLADGGVIPVFRPE